METIRGIEVGHVFKLGTKYSDAMGATYLDEKSEERNMVMGCYGIGTGRTVAASIEQNHDKDGIIWPVPIAPFPVTLLTLDVGETALMEASARIVTEFEESGIEVLWDDRDERPGVKFKDADLIGCPVRIVIGSKSFKKGEGEIRIRRSGDQSTAPLEELTARVEELLRTIR
jgi:prolyl-tRNA synthetase